MVGRLDARPGGWTFRAGPGTPHARAGLPPARAAASSPTSISVGRRVSVDIADMATHIWGNGMEFENPLVVTLDIKLVYRRSSAAKRT